MMRKSQKNPSGKRKIVQVFARIEGRAVPFEWIAESRISKDFDLSFVILNPGPSEFESCIRATGVPVLSLKYRAKSALPRAIYELGAHFRAHHPDIVHTHLADANVAGLLASRLAGVPGRMYTRHHSDFNHIYFPHAVYQDRFMNSLATKIVATCETGRRVLMDMEGVADEKIKIVNFGLKMELFDDVTDEKVEELRIKYKTKGKFPVVGVIAKYIEWKGIQYVIEAFREQVLKAYPNACLVLANAFGPAHIKEIHRLLGQLPQGSYSEIKFEGQLGALYRLFDVFAHVPVDPVCEAFGQTYIEALAARIPSVFTLSGIAREFIEHERNALVVNFRDSEDLAKALLRLLAEPDLAQRLSRQGRKDIETLFPLSRMIDSLHELYSL
ncbi:MAG: glycosyltransferase family 4 protein [Deltaproteobacteria bacterium]|nr:glycosyltransferase family 4 protein [Deltaproteobacteria bacterium]